MVCDAEPAKSNRRQSDSDEQRSAFYFIDSMRSRGPSKQRLWLGAGRYSCCGGRRYTNADAHCYSDSDRHANCQSHRDGNGDGYAATNANAPIRANGKAASHASAEAIEFRGTEFWS